MQRGSRQGQGIPPDLRTEQHSTLTAKALAESELGDLMNSHGTKHVSADTWAELVSLPTAVLGAADDLAAAANLPARRSGTALAPTPSVAKPSQSATVLHDARAAFVALFDDTSAIAELSDGQVAGLVSTLEWLTFLDDLRGDSVAELSAARSAVSRSWGQ